MLIWDNRFNLGLTEIDQQHRHLLDLVNQLADHVVTDGSTPELSKRLAQLTDYVTQHFAMEDAIWQHYLGDDALVQYHHFAHESTLQELSQLNTALTTSPSVAAENALRWFIRCFADQVCGHDRYMACRVIAQQQGLSEADAQQQAMTQMTASMRAVLDMLLTLRISAHKQAEDRSRKLTARLHKLASHVPGFLYQYQLNTDGSSRFSYASPGIKAIYGVSAEAVEHDAEAVFAMLHPDDCAAVRESIRHSAEHLSQWHERYRVNHSDGRLLWVEGHATPEHQADGSTVWHGYIHDVTDQVQAESVLKTTNHALSHANNELEQLATVFTHASEGIIITAPDGAILNVNHAFCQITGYDREELIGQNPRLLQSGRHTAQFYRQMWHSLSATGHWSGEVYNRRKDGKLYIQQLTINAVHNTDGSIRHYVGLTSDITVQKEHQQQLDYLAQYDPLTQLPNRMLLTDRLLQAMAQTVRRDAQLAIAYLDVDGFKTINDAHSHAIGDRLLCALTERLQSILRASDVLGRLGGDEFAIVLPDLPDTESCRATLDRILQAVSEPFVLDETQVTVSASLGVTFYPQAEAIDADQLLRQADQAMYQAKLAGKNRYHIFDMVHDRAMRDHHESLERIQQALDAQEFVLYYQPKVNMRSGQVIGVEGLIRWQHPERGLLAPIEFLPAIDNHPLAVAVGHWVIETALTQLEIWQQAGLDLSISINIGADQLKQADFVTHLKQHLAAHPQVHSRHLELEILESSALEDITQVFEIIKQCQAIGIEFALDDFGTGYSSLTYLKRLPAQILKIDGSFVRDMLVDPDDLAILTGVLGLAAAFQRQAIAEGVETVRHGERLLELGCELAQGYGIARPMPAADIPGWIRRWQPPVSWIV